MRYGTVIQYFPDKKFGFIQPDKGEDIFFHISAVAPAIHKYRSRSGRR